MAKLMQKKLEASTLIEVLIAMVIIMVIFAIAMTVFNHVLSGGVSYRKVRVQQQMQIISREVMRQGYISKDSIMADSVAYVLNSDTSGVAGVAKLEIRASSSGQRLGSMKCLFKLKPRDEEN